MGVTRFDRERTCPGNRLATVHRGCRADLIDEEGNLLRSWSVEGSLQWERALRLKDGGLLVVGADIHQWPEGSGSVPGQIADETRYVMRFDREGNVLWKRFLTAHHDLEIRPDGRIAVLTFERRLAPEIDDEVRTRDDRLTLLDPDDGSELESIGMLSMVLASPEVFPLSEVKAVEFGGERWIDVFHSNSIEWMDREPLFGTHPLYSPEHALVSFRNQDRVAIFDTRRRDVAWAWGRGEVRGPHDAQLLPGGTILLFDNGLGRKWSRAIEVDPRTDEIVWEWRSDPPEDFYSASRGAAQRLPNGNTLLTESSRGRAIELAPDGEIVWEWYCPHLARNGDRLTIVRMQWVGDVD